LSDTVPFWMFCNKRSFIFIACQLRFGIRGYEGRRKSGGNRVGWEHQFLFCADDVNLLDEKNSVAKKNIKNPKM
jgi:hypothetical protein